MTRIAAICLVVAATVAGALALPTNARAQAYKPSRAPPPLLADATPCVGVDMKAVSVPSDFSITYFSGPSHRNWPGRRTQVTVNADGVVKYFVGNAPRTKGAPPELPLKQRKISKERVKRIFARVVACGFFDLKRNYRNPRIRDGGYRHLSVTADGKTNSVNVSYYSVTRFSSIVAALGRETGVQLH
jgi:hypothetical protein